MVAAGASGAVASAWRRVVEMVKLQIDLSAGANSILRICATSSCAKTARRRQSSACSS